MHALLTEDAPCCAAPALVGSQLAVPASAAPWPCCVACTGRLHRASHSPAGQTTLHARVLVTGFRGGMLAVTHPHAAAGRVSSHDPSWCCRQRTASPSRPSTHSRPQPGPALVTCALTGRCSCAASAEQHGCQPPAGLAVFMSDVDLSCRRPAFRHLPPPPPPPISLSQRVDGTTGTGRASGSLWSALRECERQSCRKPPQLAMPHGLPCITQGEPSPSSACRDTGEPESGCASVLIVPGPSHRAAEVGSADLWRRPFCGAAPQHPHDDAVRPAQAVTWQAHFLLPSRATARMTALQGPFLNECRERVWWLLEGRYTCAGLGLVSWWPKCWRDMSPGGSWRKLEHTQAVWTLAAVCMSGTTGTKILGQKGQSLGIASPDNMCAA